MDQYQNPALEAFLAAFPSTVTVAQVVVTRRGEWFEIRHVSDQAATDSILELVEAGALRALASHTRTGKFRPLKSAPDLRTGWRTLARTPHELESALEHLYPGVLADWFALQRENPPVTHYRDFVGRQTGMYRIASMLTDLQVNDLAGACCHPDSCLKRRLWGGPGLGPDTHAEKSLIPCLEPCAVLLEFARKSMRLEQEEKVTAQVSPGDLETVLAAIRSALEHSAAGEREGDFNAPENPRRLRRMKILVERWLAETPKEVEK